MRNSTTLSMATVLLLSAPAAFAAPLLRPMHPLKPPMETSSSSSATVTESASSASSAKLLPPKLLKPMPPNAGGMMGYCMQIKEALKKGQSVTPSAANADKFNLSIDFLTKANALCEAMKAEQQSSSSWMPNTVTPNSQSSSGYKGFKQPNYNECKVIGPDKTMAGIKYCKIQCGLTIKSDLCSKY